MSVASEPPSHSPGRRVHRDVVSFVRRSSRMNPSQAKAWAAYADRLLVDVARGETETSVAADAKPLNLAAVFGRIADVVVEIGCGSGNSPVTYATAHPNVNVLAFEVFQPALASALSATNRAGVTNLRFCMADGAAALDRLLPERSVSELRVFFPDPWPKARHHKRRLVSPSFLDAAARALRPGARLVLATDWADYVEHACAVVGADPRWIGGVVDRDIDRPLTKFEARAQQEGREVVDLAWTLKQPE